MVPRAGLDRCVKSRPPPVFDPRTFQSVANRYTDYATRPIKFLEHKYIFLSTALFCYSLLGLLLNCHVLRERNKLIEYTRPSSDPPSEGISRG